MKKCDHYKDLILTDYIDGELDKAFKGDLENHLLDCHECRGFFREVKNNTVQPFLQAKHQPVPEGLWAAIRENIEHEEQASNLVEDFIERLKGLLVFPKVVPVFASLIVMLLAGSAALNTVQLQQFQQTRANDQGEYLVSVLGSTDAPATSDNNGLGTSIEHYFL